MGDFVHLHAYSGYSPLRGNFSVQQLVDHAALLGQTAVALTDQYALHGIPAFLRYAEKKGIKPIVGCCVQLAARRLTDKSFDLDGESHSLLLLCRDQAGYRNLCRLSSLSYRQGHYIQPRVDAQALAAHREGLIALSGGYGGLVEDLLRSGKAEAALDRAKGMQEIFGDRYYLEVQNHGLPWQAVVNQGLEEIGRRAGIGLVVTNSAGFADRGAYDAWLLHCGRQAELPNQECTLKSGEEMAALFTPMAEALDNTNSIAAQCTMPPGERRIFPAADRSRTRQLMAQLAEYADAQGIPVGIPGEGKIECAPGSQAALIAWMETRQGEGGTLSRVWEAQKPSAAEALRQAGLAHGLGHDQIEKMVAMLPRTQGKKAENLQQAEKLYRYCKQSKFMDFFKSALEVQAQTISKKPLPGVWTLADPQDCPVFMMEDQLYAQYDLHQLEGMGALPLRLQPSPLLATVHWGAAAADLDLAAIDPSDPAVFAQLGEVALLLRSEEVGDRIAQKMPTTLEQLAVLFAPDDPDGAGLYRGRLAYQAAFIRLCDPPGFFAAALNASQGNKKAQMALMKQMRRGGIPLLSPCINAPELLFCAEEGGVRFPLTGVGGIGFGFAGQIRDEWKRGGSYASFSDFCQRAAPQREARATESLIRAGGMDSLATRAAMLELWSDPANRYSGIIPTRQEYPHFVRCMMEWEETGQFFSGNPLDGLAPNLAALNGISVTQALERAARPGLVVTVGGVITAMRFHRTRAGEPMAFVTLEDGGAELQALVFAEVLDSAGPYLKPGRPIALTGSFTGMGEEIRLNCRKAEALDGAEGWGETPVDGQSLPTTLWLRVESFEDPILDTLRQTVGRYPGTAKICLYSMQEKKTVVWNRIFTDIQQELIEELKALCGPENVALQR